MDRHRFFVNYSNNGQTFDGKFLTEIQSKKLHVSGEEDWLDCAIFRQAILVQFSSVMVKI